MSHQRCVRCGGLVGHEAVWFGPWRRARSAGREIFARRVAIRCEFCGLECRFCQRIGPDGGVELGRLEQRRISG